MTKTQIQIELAEIDDKLDALDRRREHLMSQLRRIRAAEWIADEGVTRDQVQMSAGKRFANIYRYAAWLCEIEAATRYCEWNGKIYETTDIVAGKNRPSPALLSDLPE